MLIELLYVESVMTKKQIEKYKDALEYAFDHFDSNGEMKMPVEQERILIKLYEQLGGTYPPKVFV